MKHYKNLIFATGLCLFSYFRIGYIETSDLCELYSGLYFNSSPMFYASYLLLFACYTLYTYNTFSDYLSQYGTVIVTRELSRNKLYNRMIKHLAKSLVQIELLKIVCFSFMLLIMKNNIHCFNTIAIVKSIIINFLVFGITLLIQMNIEIFYSADVSVVISFFAYILSIGAADIIGTSSSMEKNFQLANLFNLTMDNRLTKLTSPTTYLVIILTLCLLLFLIYQLGKKRFQYKDIL